ncbi:MAG TPA: chromate transporter [Xanthobacteraceae bacterium]|nr:chromate transporter [Xanthobacteraceae bacterium]
MKFDLGGALIVGLHFALLSLLAVGGANAVIPEVHRLSVDVQQWLTERQFADIFAIAQAAPGPNFLISTLIGYHVAGWAGAVMATLGMCGPSCMLAYYVSRTWERFRYARWRIVIQNGLVPVSVGLVGASGIIVARAADHTPFAFLITGITAVVTYFTRINPGWLFAAAGLLGIAGWL